MDEAQRAELLAANGWEAEDLDAGTRAGIGILVSVLTLRWFDLVCLGLAAGTAYKGASRNVKAEVDLLNGQTGVIRVEAPAGVFAAIGRAEESKDSKSDSPRPGRPSEPSDGAGESRRAA